MNKGFLENLKDSKHLNPFKNPLSGAGKNAGMFHLNGVSVSFGKVHALKNINLQIKKGQILFVTGKSGAGKSTLLNVLAGDQAPTSGAANLPSRKVFVSQVFQDLKLFQNRSIEENLWYAYDRSVYKSKREFHGDMLELAGVLGLRDRLGEKIVDINGGMKQKTSMLRALLSRPDVLLADEPTASLDKESSSKLFDLLNFYNVRKGLTIVWATHNRDLIKQFPGEIAHLEGGRLIYSGKACFI